MLLETHTYRVVENCAVKLDLYRPQTGTAAPVIVWIHGGALIGGGRGSMQPVVRHLLAERGFAQASIDYRLAPETKLPEIIDDLREAFRWVRGRLPIECSVDTERVGVIGGSAGGYLTLMAGLAVSPRPKALVSLYGYGDIIGPWYSEPDAFYLQSPKVTEDEARSVVGAVPISESRPGGPDRFRFYLWCRQNGAWPREVMGVDPKSDPAAFTPYCPEQNVDENYPPTLLIHGDADTDVPHQRSVDMAHTLALRGVSHELISVPGAPHGFDGRIRPWDWPEKRNTAEGAAIARIVDWFSAHV